MNNEENKRKFPVKPSECLSTHGAAGFAAGSYIENGYVVCAACGTKINNKQAIDLANKSSYIYGSERAEDRSNRLSVFGINMNRNTIIETIAFALLILALAFSLSRVFAKQEDKIYWCHAEPNGNQQTLHLPLQALQNAGHVSANGNPLHAGDHAGKCVEVTPTPQITITPTVTPSPTIIPCDGCCEEECVTPTPTVEVTPVSETHNDVVTVASTTNTSGDCSALEPQPLNDIWYSDDVKGDGKLTLHWGVDTQYSRAHIVYGLTPGDIRYSILNTDNDGVEEIGGLDSHTIYWFSVGSVHECSVGDYTTWRDPQS